MKIISLNFEGYWREINKSFIPEKSGVYCVYACAYNASEKTVSLRKILYIGESENVRNRISNHDRLSDWKKLLYSGETLCYSFAFVSATDRLRAEAALIYRHKPPCNSEYVYGFPFAETTIKTSGRNDLLLSEFTV